MTTFRFFVRNLPWLVTATLLLPQTAAALTYVSMPDEVLADKAAVIVVATILDAAPEPGHERSAARYRLQVEQRVKGLLVGEDIDVVVPGGIGPRSLTVAGAPRFARAEQVLLFLDRRVGHFALTQFALGAFHVRKDAAGKDLILRELGDATELSLATGKPLSSPDRPRDLQRFVHWLGERAAGRDASVDYWRDDGSPVSGKSAKYQLAGQPPARWAEFDEGRTVTMYASGGPQLNLLGGGYEEFRQALDAWNTDAGSAVRLAYGGTAATNSGLTRADGLNSVQFNDPDDDLAGIFDCLKGGVLATTGTWVGNARSWQGGNFLPLIEADIIVQDGASCFLGLLGNANAAELFAHELGHALGLAHSCGESPTPACAAGSAVDDAVMRPVLHADGRGATLSSDDRRGIAYLYSATVPPQNDPGNADSPSSAGSGGGALSPLFLFGLLLAGLRRTRLVCASPL